MPRDIGSFDVRLSYAGGEPKSYTLAEENGLLLWHEGLVPVFVQQQNVSGFGYNALPADLSTLLVFEDWSGGAGMVSAPAGSSSTNRYSFSRGIDASWGDRLYLSPQKQAISGISGTVLRFYTSPSFGEYALVSSTTTTPTTTARYVYQFSGGAWVQRYDAGSDIITDILEYGNATDVYLVIARGDGNDIVYSTNGSAFTNTSTGNRGTFLAIRGHTSVNPILHAITSTGAIASTTGIDGTWSAADQIGSTGETVNGLEVSHDVIVLLKAEGVYTFDGIDVQQRLQANALYRATNGRAHCQFNGLVYFNFDNRIVEYDVVNDTFRTVYFPEHPELNGNITAMTATTVHMYFTITNSSGGVYVMKGNPDTAWHTLHYLGSLAVNALHVIRGGVNQPSSTNDVLIFDGNSTTGYYILAQDGLRPEDDSAYRFDTTQGYIYGPLLDGGILSFVKRLNGARLVGENLTGANAVGLSYGIDDVDTTPTSIITAVESGLTEERITTDTPFTRLHYYATMDNVGNTSSPRVLSIVFDATPYPPRRRRFTFVVELEWRGGAAGGVQRRDAFTALRRHLHGAVREQCTLVDPWDGSYTVKLQEYQMLGFKYRPMAGTGNQAVYALYQIVADEITEAEAPSANMVWDQTNWNDGRTWGS